MTLSSRTTIDKTEVLEDGSIQVRQAEIITKDGVEITRTFNQSGQGVQFNNSSASTNPCSILNKFLNT